MEVVRPRNGALEVKTMNIKRAESPCGRIVLLMEHDEGRDRGGSDRGKQGARRAAMPTRDLDMR